MRPHRILLLLILLLSATSAFSYVDLNLNYTYTKRVVDEVDPTIPEEDLGKATSITEGASVNWAWYIWEYTALELNYSETKDNVIDDREIIVDADLTILKVNSLTKTTVMGAGIRQSFASRKAAIIPSFAFGYAKMVQSGTTTYTLNDSGTEQEVSIEQDQEEYGSGYVSFQLRFRLTQLMGFTLAAKSVFPDFDTSLAEDNLTYSAGFSWVF
jgi:hypothetical protein